MKTFEIYQMINNLDPENNAQAKLIKKLLRVIENDTLSKYNDRTQAYIDTLNQSDIFGKEVGAVYNDYVEYCQKHYCIPLERSHFGKRLCECINVKSKIKRVGEKIIRVYY